ncbi:MAG TPA: Ig-like domain-containing protein, partial [Gemmatimonadales bacterium]|nr:Ig-like domain-containing protein [Gemmatimonadales bacterium]
MRKALAVAVLVVACSSGNVTGSGSTGSTGSTPASVAVVSGDGQTGAPGSPVATDPGVEVKDASGNPVSGITVTFRVDSGGGTIAGGTASTGSNGIATAGTWTLGPAAGRNTLIVTAGSLTPIRVGATASLAATTILTTTTINTGSGTFQVLDPGPLHGFSLATPAGAVSAPLQLTISYGSATGVGGLQGLTSISPVITLSNPTVAYLQAPMTIHIAATVPSGMTPVIVMFNTATGAREALPTLDWDSTGVTALVSSLSTDNMTLQTTGGSLGDFITVQMTVISLPSSQLEANYDSGFRPSADGWEFPLASTVVDTAAVHTGMLATSAWYFVAHPSSAKLFGRFQLAPNVALSDRAGLRWMSIVSNQMLDYFNAVSDYNKLFGTAAKVDQNQFNAVTAAMSMGLAGPQPQLVVLYPDRNGGGAFRLVLAYRKSGNTLSVYDPSAPGDN